MMKAEKIRKYIEIGKQINDTDQIKNSYPDTTNYDYMEYCYITNAIKNGCLYSDHENLGKEIEAYRIGIPGFDELEEEYYPSHNFAEGKNESGVSICTGNWFNSLKSIFFGISDEKIKAKGVYKIKGVIIGFGGDDEPLLYLTEHPEKVGIRTLNGLKKAVKKLGI